MSHAIEAENLTKIFETKERKGLFKRGKKKRVVAVDHISFKVRRGEVFGLLGPNGAGKTTTIKMLTTLLLPDEGEAWVNGYHVVKEADKVRESIGVSLTSERGFYWKLTGRENLRYFAFLYHIPPKQAEKRIDYLLKLVGLEKDADKLVEEYSTGMKAKLAFARALINDAPIIFLDEPTLGLDPVSARKIREVILELKKNGKTIFLTTHNMGEAEQLCDHIAIINRGKIVAMGTASELKRLVKKRDVIEVEASGIKEDIISKLRELSGVAFVTYSIKDAMSMQGVIRIGLSESSRSILPDIVSFLARAGVRVEFVKISEPTLEDVFVEVTGVSFYEEHLRDAQEKPARR